MCQGSSGERGVGRNWGQLPHFLGSGFDGADQEQSPAVLQRDSSALQCVSCRGRSDLSEISWDQDFWPLLFI